MNDNTNSWLNLGSLGLAACVACSGAGQLEGDVGQVGLPPSEESAPPKETAPSEGGGGYWALVRSEDSGKPYAEEWKYDEDAQLLRARVVRMRRDADPYYLLTQTFTRNTDHLTVFEDFEPEEYPDVTSEYVFESGRIVLYSESAEGTVNVSRSFEYDAEGKLVGGYENNWGDEGVLRLERSDGRPFELFRNEQLVCSYFWRHVWLGTTCYLDGQEFERYEAVDGLLRSARTGSSMQYFTYDAAQRLTSLTSDDSKAEYIYSPEGKLLEAILPYYNEVREYDEHGLLRAIHNIDASGTSTTSYEYERVSPDEVIERYTFDARTVTATYRRFDKQPSNAPKLPSFYDDFGISIPMVYYAPTDYSAVP